MATLLSGSATVEGTKRYVTKLAGSVVAEHFRGLEGLAVSTVGLGTYLGPEDGATDVLYQDAIARAFELGVNMIDTAINYRHQRSERAIRTVLAAAVRRGAIRRDAEAEATAHDVAVRGQDLPLDAIRARR